MAPLQKKDVGGTKNNEGAKVTKRTVQFTSTGRAVIVPKKILTTSSDEVPPRRRSKASNASVQKGLEELRAFVVNNPQLSSLLKSSISAPTSQTKQQRNQKQTKKNYVLQSAYSKNMTTPKNSTIQSSSKEDWPSSHNMKKVTELASSSASEKSAAEEQTIQAEPQIPTGNNSFENPRNTTPFTSRIGSPVTWLGNEMNTGADSDDLDLSKRYSENEDSIYNNNNNEYRNLESELESGTNTENNPHPENSREHPAGVIVKKCVPPDVEQHLQRMMNEYSEIKNLLKEIKADIKSIKTDIDIANVKPLFAAPEGFPLHTIQEFDAFEGDRNQQKKLYLELRKYGGTNAREALKTALKSSITDELSLTFTWFGEKGTKSLSESKLASILHRVVKKCPNFPGPESATEFKHEMIEVLRGAKQRHRKKIALAKRPRKTEVRESEGEDGSTINSELEYEYSDGGASDGSVGKIRTF